MKWRVLASAGFAWWVSTSVVAQTGSADEDFELSSLFEEPPAQDSSDSGTDSEDIPPASPSSGDKSGNTTPAVIELPEDAPDQAVDSSVRRPPPLIEEIVVTAEKREASIHDVPITINAFKGDSLKYFGVEDTRDLRNILPGFTAAESGYNTPVYTLRGVGFNDATYSATPTVGIYTDEVNMPYAIMTKGAALDLERVEVLKGPQGILYGRNTTGGAINYITNRPTDSFSSSLSAKYGRYDTSVFEGHISGPIGQSELRYRLAGKDQRSREGDQYSHTRPSDRLGRQDKQALRAMLDWAATDSIDLQLRLEGWRDRSEPRAGQVLFVEANNPTDFGTGLTIPPQARNYPTISQTDASPQQADWDPSRAWRLNDSFRLAAVRSDWSLTDSITATALVSHMRVESNGSAFPQSAFNFEASEQVINAYLETNQAELRFVGDSANSSLRWLVGVTGTKDQGFESHEQLVSHTSVGFPNPITGRSTLTDAVLSEGRPEVEQLAGFANLDWAFASTWTLAAGLRYTQQEQRFTGCTREREDQPGLLSAAFAALSVSTAVQYALANPGELGEPDPIILAGECMTTGLNGSTEAFRGLLKEDNLAYRLALSWNAPGDNLIYASYVRGFKAGGFPVLPASTQLQYTPVAQEELVGPEIGGKFLLADRQIQTNLAAFYYQYTNKQLLTRLLDPVFGPLPTLQNAPKSRVWGAELQIDWAPHALYGLRLAGTLAYTRTQVTEFVGLDNQGDEFDFSGRPFNFAPELQYTLAASYQAAVTQRHFLLAGVDYYSSSATNATVEEDPRYAHNSYSLLGARLVFSPNDESWSLSVYGRNLLDELYSNGIYKNGDSIVRLAGQGRTFGATIEVSWE